MLNSLKWISDIYIGIFISVFMLCDIVSTVCGKRCWKYAPDKRATAETNIKYTYDIIVLLLLILI